MKLTATNRKILDFMSGSGGRLLRGTFGVLLIISAATMGGWYWLLAPMGLFMIATGVMNYCPAGLMMTGSGRSEDILANIAKVDALGSQVGKH